ncbi:MAG: hypothetical protein M3157_06665 [Actinomycetota bacterium]|nr:hypothetical protein [Actinomycetota bacterium]
MSENRERGTQADPNRDPGDAGLTKEKWGRGVCIVGLGLALLGIIAAFLGTGASIVPGGLGIMLGILGYFLGANRLGTITIILSTAVLFFGLAASQGIIPGMERDDRGLPQEEPRAEDN